MVDDGFVVLFGEWLKENYFSGRDPGYYLTNDYRNSIIENAYARADRLEKNLVPWIKDVFDLRSANVVEIGSGTGSSAQALYKHCKSIVGFETEPLSLASAKKRAELLGMGNLSFREEMFTSATDLTDQDAVILVGVIEHMPLDVVIEVLSTAYRILRPGGVIVIADTPNRLSAFDYHTSWLPFFQWLPPELQARCYQGSPRENFVHEIDAASAIGFANDRIRNWGIGVSFHEFELALGHGVHDMIIADGWEDHILPLMRVFDDDRWLLDMFEKMNVKAHKAFARSWLHLIIQKPA